MKQNKIGYGTILSLAPVLLLVAIVALALHKPPVDAAANHSTAQVYQFDPFPAAGDAVPGAMARLVRNRDGASAQFLSEGLAPGEVVTLWWVIFDNPEACAAHPAPCDLHDLLANTAAVKGEVFYGTGELAGASGRVAVGSRLSAGSARQGWFGNGFANPATAEIHLLLQSHGQAIPALAGEMLSTFRAGCQDDGFINRSLPARAYADGTPGPNRCALLQYAIFQ